MPRSPWPIICSDPYEGITYADIHAQIDEEAAEDEARYAEYDAPKTTTDIVNDMRQAWGRLNRHCNMQDVLYWNSPPPSERRIVQDMSRYDSSMMDQLIQARRSQYELMVQVDGGGQYNFLNTLGFRNERVTRRQRDDRKTLMIARKGMEYQDFIKERDSHG